MNLKILILLILLFFYSCYVPDLKLAKNTSINILDNLKSNDWDSLWYLSSISYKKKIGYERMLKLKKWVYKELGKLKNYNLKSFYTGSSIGMAGEYYVTLVYDVIFEKGNGEIEIILITEENQFKIYNIDFFKKPIF